MSEQIRADGTFNQDTYTRNSVLLSLKPSLRIGRAEIFVEGGWNAGVLTSSKTGVVEKEGTKSEVQFPAEWAANEWYVRSGVNFDLVPRAKRK